MLNLLTRDAVFASFVRLDPDGPPVPSPRSVTLPRACAHSFAAVGDGVVWGWGSTEAAALDDAAYSLAENLSEGAARPVLSTVPIRESRYREIVAGTHHGARVDAAAIEPCYGPAVVVEVEGEPLAHCYVREDAPELLVACREHRAPLRVDGLPSDDGRAILVSARVAEAMRALGLRRRGQVYSPGLVTRVGEGTVAQWVVWHADLSAPGPDGE
jgi:hypothetical protein